MKRITKAQVRASQHAWETIVRKTWELKKGTAAHIELSKKELKALLRWARLDLEIKKLS